MQLRKFAEPEDPGILWDAELKRLDTTKSIRACLKPLGREVLQ